MPTVAKIFKLLKNIISTSKFLYALSLKKSAKNTEVPYPTLGR